MPCPDHDLPPLHTTNFLPMPGGLDCRLPQRDETSARSWLHRCRVKCGRSVQTTRDVKYVSMQFILIFSPRPVLERELRSVVSLLLHLEIIKAHEVIALACLTRLPYYRRTLASPRSCVSSRKLEVQHPGNGLSLMEDGGLLSDQWMTISPSNAFWPNNQRT